MNCQHIVFIPETTSTNCLLKTIIHEQRLENRELDEFYTLYTDFQVAGKGLAGNAWHSHPKENVLASFYFKPPLAPSQQFYFNIFFSLSVWEVLNKYLHPVKIKWPNDMYVGEKKIAGILIEHSLAGERLAYSIAGIGINLNQAVFPPDIPNPTSFKLERGCEFDRLTIIREIIAAAGRYYPLLREGQFDRLLEEYYSHLYHLYEYRRYLIFGKETEACITGVDHYGRLLLKDREGKEYCCGYKEVGYLFN